MLSIVSFLLFLFLNTDTLSFKPKWSFNADVILNYNIRRKGRGRNHVDKVYFFLKPNRLDEFCSLIPSQLSLPLAAARRPDVSKILQQLVELEEKEEEDEALKQKPQVTKGTEGKLRFHDKIDLIKIVVPSQYDNTRVDLVLDKLLPQSLQNLQQHYQHDDDDGDFTFSSWDDIPNVKLSRTQIASLIQERDVYISLNLNNNTKNGEGEEDEEKVLLTQKSLLVSSGQILWIPRTAIIQKLYYDANPLSIVPENITLSILYEDEYMIVVNKQAGLVVHPAVGNWNGTLVNALAFYLTHQSPFGPGELFVQDLPKDQDGRQLSTEVPNRPGIVHRLDKGTSGVIIVAKTTAALQALSEMFAQRKVRKTYVAITVGNPGNRVVIDNYISRHPRDRQRMRVTPMRQQPLKQRQESPSANVKNIVEETKLSLQSSLSGGKQVAEVGRRAISFVDTKAFDGKLAFVEVRIPTGRTHQIRVHLQDRGTPVYGDDTYGLVDWNKKLRKRSGSIARPLLHALELELDHHPIVSIDARVNDGNDGGNSKKLRFRAPLPQDMAMVTDSIWPQGRMERPDYFNPQKAED